MIEEFMLLANREVATFIFNKKEGRQSSGTSTFVYRTHDDPDPEKLENFSKFAMKFGHKFDVNGPVSKNLNKLMAEIEGKPEQNVLESIAIRSMAKARYTTDPKGHFGLAFDHYTHFTSPIRRYPDIIVHRLLAKTLAGKPVSQKDIDAYNALSLHTSTMEKFATEAERASTKYKQVEYMSSRVGETFDGVISGVTEWGIFVEERDTKSEGMIRLANLPDDYYVYDEKNFQVVGKSTKKKYRLGDTLKILVEGIDVERRLINYKLA